MNYTYKLLLSILCGGIIGIEREIKHKSAGLKTNIFICVGALLFTQIAVNLDKDAARVIAPIISGMGFIGAGTIIKSGDKINGLTTAALLWLTAGLGIAIGLDYESLAFTTAIISVTTNWLIGKIEQKYIRKELS